MKTMGRLVVSHWADNPSDTKKIMMNIIFFFIETP
jgi:hypothetical protein